MMQMKALALTENASSRLPLVALPSFDLAQVMARVASEHGDWSSDRLQKAEDGYRMFMAQAKATNGETQENPAKDVDEVWHCHILYTRQYAADCTTYFGYFLHHVPPCEGKTCCVGR